MRRFDVSPSRDSHHVRTDRAMKLSLDQIPADLWVFGYGSLLWRPGFAFTEKVPARVTGLHRSLCIYSFVHRGTPERPGLVLGLDRGGACRGIAFRVAAAEREAMVAYLREREQVDRGLSRSAAQRDADRPSGPAGRGADLRGRPRPSAICRQALARSAPASDPAGPRTLGRQPRIMCWRRSPNSRRSAAATRNCTRWPSG